MAKGKDIGALWVRRSNKGEYMTGYVMVGEQKIPIVCFLNGYKKEEKHPDWRILPSEPKEARVRTDAEDRGYDRQADAAQPEDEINTDDIPF